MPIPHVAFNDTQAIDKVNQAIDQANRVDDIVASIADEADTRELQIQAEAEARAEGIEGEAEARQQSDADRPTFAQASRLGSRPGEAPAYFASSTDGAPEIMVDLVAVPAVGENGAAVAIAGAGLVASRQAFRIEPGREYRIRFVVQRSVNTEDPANDAVRLGVRWLDKNKAGISSQHLANLLDVTVASGRIEFQFNISLTDASNIDAIPVGGAIYFRPYVQAFGGGVTLVEVIEVTDLTLSADWSPDVSEYRREIAGLQQQLADALDRITALEA